MTCKQLLPRLSGAVAAALLAAGCGSGSASGTAVSSGTGAAGSAQASASRATSASTTASVGTGGHSAGHDPAHALPLQIDAMPQSGTLVDTKTPDFYSFTGAKGDILVLGATAQGLVATSNGFDPTIIDTYVTLWAPGMQPIAADNDGWPDGSTDSQLYVELPSAGTYYVQVEDCLSHRVTHPGVPCHDDNASQVTTFDYEVYVFRTKALVTPVEVGAGAAQDGTTTNAVPIAYALPPKATPGSYGFYVLDGNLRTTTDTHVFSFTPPMDTAVSTGQRARAEFWVQPIGADDGDGSTADVRAWVTDDAAGKHIVARVDEEHYSNGDDLTNGPLDLSLPITLGTTYYLFIQSTEATSSPDTDYYFVEHMIGDYYLGQAELEGPTAQGKNDTPATAEPLLLTTTGLYAIDGDISAPATSTAPDVDWFTLKVPPAVTGAFVFCEIDRSGSGLGGFTATLHDGASPTTVLGNPIGPEVANANTNFGNATPIPVTASATVLLRLEAATQDPTDTGTYYRCFVQFQ